jgi:hypothetical protein
MTINLERRAFVQSGALLATGVALADAVATPIGRSASPRRSALRSKAYDLRHQADVVRP